MFWAMILNIFIDGGFKIYLIYLKQIGSRNWEPPGELTDGEAEDNSWKMKVYIFMFLQYVFALALYYLSKKEAFTRARDFIVHVFILSVCLEFYLTRPF